MGQVLTNDTALIYARESSLGVLPGSPDWKELEPNSLGEFGASITTVARNPISKLRQRRKGTVVDLDAANEYDGDLTLDSLVDFIEAFLFANAVNGDLTFRGGNAESSTSGYVIAAATTAQAAKLQYTSGGPISLVYAAGYVLDANNGLKPLAADVAGTDTKIQVAGLADETAPTNAEVSVAGIRAEAGDLALAVSSGVGTLSSGNNSASNNIDFTTLGLTIGQRIHVGGMTSANRFGSTAGGSNDSFGSARIVTIAAAAITLDKMDATLTASDGTDTGSSGTNVAVDLLFGRFIRNVARDNSDYALISHHFEQSYPNLFETEPPTPVASPNGYEYVVGAVASEWTWNLPLTNKSDSTFAFIGTNAEEPVNDAARKSGASSARSPLFTEAFNTSLDFFRLRLEDVDESGLSTDFKSLTVAITNNVTAEKVLALLGARYINVGNFELDVTGEALFTNADVPTRIRNNTTVSMDWLLKNNDGAIAVDVPSATIGSDGKTYPVNETVRIQLSVAAHVDPIFNTSIGVSLFPVFPTS